MELIKHSYGRALRSWSIMGGAAGLNYAISLGRIKVVAILWAQVGGVDRALFVRDAPNRYHLRTWDQRQRGVRGGARVPRARRARDRKDVSNSSSRLL